MHFVGAFSFKYFQEPLIPVAGTIDLAPFLIMVALLTAGSVFMRWGRGANRQRARRTTQGLATAAFVIGLHPCACMLRDLIRGGMQVNYDNLLAFQLLMLVVPVAAFAMMWGRVFCGWVCPIGFIQEITTKATCWMRRSPKRKQMQGIRFAMATVLLVGTVALYVLEVRPANEPLLQGMAAGYLIMLSVLIILSVADAQWEVRLRTVRYVALSFFVIVTVIGVYWHAAFCVLFTNDWRRSPVMLLVGVLFASLVLSQAWCRFLCPEGALLSLLTKLSGWKIQLERSRCSSCNTCHEVCPVEAIEVGEVDEKSCLYCCRCVDACPTQAIDLSDGGSRPGTIAALPVLRGRGAS